MAQYLTTLLISAFYSHLFPPWSDYCHLRSEFSCQLFVTPCQKESLSCLFTCWFSALQHSLIFINVHFGVGVSYPIFCTPSKRCPLRLVWAWQLLLDVQLRTIRKFTRSDSEGRWSLEWVRNSSSRFHYIGLHMSSWYCSRQAYYKVCSSFTSKKI